MSAIAFDPYAALADIQNGSGLRAKRANGANPEPTLAPLAPLAFSPAPNPKPGLPLAAPSDPAVWGAVLASLDPSRAHAGIAPDRWRTLLADARWLANQHGDTAAAFGWTASDLFGVRQCPGWGGVADRLEGARDVQFDARRVRWSHDEGDWSVLIRMARSGRMALQCGVPVWELAP